MSINGDIPISGNFLLNSKIPLDPRTSVKTKDDLDRIEHPYPGLMVWVENFENDQPNAVVYSNPTEKFIQLVDFLGKLMSSRQKKVLVQEEKTKTIDHGLGKIPRVTILDNLGQINEASIEHDLQTLNSFKVSFLTPFTGEILYD